MDLLAFVLALLAEGKTSEEVRAAVDEYLEDNPTAINQAAVEAILDGRLDDIEDDVSGLKSALTTLEDGAPYAPAISGETESKNSFTADELSGYDNYFAVCDAANTDYLGIAKSPDILPLADSVSTTKWSKGVGNSLVVNTTITGESYYNARYNSAYDVNPLDNIVENDTVNFAIIVNGAITGQTGSARQWVKLRLIYADNTEGAVTLDIPQNGGYVSGSTVVTKNVQKITVQMCFMWGTYDNVEISWSATKGENAIYSFYAGGGEKRFGKNDVGNNGFTVFPCNAYVTYVFDTKEYVDEHIPDGMLVAGDLIYKTPEMYGAFGDGVHDDTAAINAMIADVLSTPAEPKAAIRGFGSYKITSGITIHGAYIDSYFRQIIYTGDGAAITLIGAYSKFRFGVINAYGGGANSVGIRCTTNATPVYAHDGFYGNHVECAAILSKGNTVELVYPSTALTEGVFYSVLKFQYQYSSNGHCFYISNGNIGELDIYGKIVHAQNGFLCYREAQSDNNGGNSTHLSIRLHQFGIEHTVKNGIHGNVSLIQCRTRELMDRPSGTDQTQDNIGGYLFDFSGVVPCADKDAYGDADLTSCNVDAALRFSDLLLMAKNKAQSGETVYNIARLLGSEGRSYARLQNCIRASFVGSRNLIPGDMYVYYRHIGYKPYEDWYHVISQDIDIQSAFGSAAYITPTIFDVNAASVNIRLDYSYCSIAINEFRIVQHPGKTAVVYDKLGNMIFDGTGLGDGTYVFKCSRVPLEDIVLDLDNNQTMTIPALYLRRVYTGENERWTISKENTIAQPSN